MTWVIAIDGSLKFICAKRKIVFWYIFFVVFFLVVVYLLLVPIVLYVDTITDQYYLRLKGFAKATFEGNKEELIHVRLKVLFLNFSFYPLRTSSFKIKKTKEAKVKKSQKKIGYRNGIRLLKSFQIKRFLLNIDTGNCIANAKLYPLFAFLNYRIGGFNVNFEGKNQLVLHIQNRPIHIIKSFVNI